MNTSIEKFRDAIASARERSGASLSRVTAYYDELILELNAVPEDIWRCLMEVFRDRELLKRRGIEKFLIEMNVDLVKYSPSQLSEFLDTIVSNAHFMDQEIARHAAGDFIARAYPPEIALKTAAKLAGGDARRRHVALVALDILRNHAKGQALVDASKIFDELLSKCDE